MSEVRINTEPTIDGSAYVVTLQASDDVAVTLTPDRALQYALGILRAAHHAAYDAAVLRQMTSINIKMEAAAEVVSTLRKDRPPLDHDATRPLRLDPGVNRYLEPFLIVSVNDDRVGQWSVEDAEQHAMFVLSTV